MPLFVVATDVEKNVVYVGEGENHPGLYRKALFISNDEIHHVRPDLALENDQSKRCKVRIRYRQPMQDAILFKKSEGLYIKFDVPQKSITAGQFAAWYDGDELIGSGTIAG